MRYGKLVRMAFRGDRWTEIRRYDDPVNSFLYKLKVYNKYVYNLTL
jgi:hypothetical protein